MLFWRILECKSFCLTLCPTKTLSSEINRFALSQSEQFGSVLFSSLEQVHIRPDLTSPTFGDFPCSEGPAQMLWLTLLSWKIYCCCSNTELQSPRVWKWILPLPIPLDFFGPALEGPKFTKYEEALQFMHVIFSTGQLFWQIQHHLSNMVVPAYPLASSWIEKTQLPWASAKVDKGHEHFILEQLLYYTSLMQLLSWSVLTNSIKVDLVVWQICTYFEWCNSGSVRIWSDGPFLVNQ